MFGKTLRHIHGFCRAFALDHFRTKLVERDWLRWKGYRPDWDNPRDINEKIQWLMCFSDTSLWTLCADKYRVRDFVRDRGLGHLLVDIHGVWSRAEDIDFEALPSKCVLKCNHDSGSSRIIDKAVGVDPKALRKFFAGRLKTKFGYWNGETFYNAIPPVVLAESFLEPSDKSLSSTPVDYKVWCFDGKPHSVWTCHGRTSDEVFVNLYDLDWNVRPEVSVFTPHYKDGQGKVPRPDNLDQMLEAAAILSKGFPEVRVDFYIVDGRLYFGEMTFASLAGKMDFYTQDYLEELGRQCVLPPKSDKVKSDRPKNVKAQRTGAS